MKPGRIRLTAGAKVSSEPAINASPMRQSASHASAEKRQGERQDQERERRRPQALHGYIPRQDRQVVAEERGEEVLGLKAELSPVFLVLAKREERRGEPFDHG